MNKSNPYLQLHGIVCKSNNKNINKALFDLETIIVSISDKISNQSRIKLIVYPYSYIALYRCYEMR